MKIEKIAIKAVAVIEVLIGLFISLSFLVSELSAPSGRPVKVFVFVIATSLISVAIGAGLFFYKRWAGKTLVFFAGYVAFSKILLATGLVTFSGNTIEVVSTNVKDLVSFFYHIAVIIMFSSHQIKKELS